MYLMKNKALLAISILLAIAFLGAGSMKLIGGMVEGFEGYGYPGWFSYFIGACEIAGAIGLFIRKTAVYAASGLLIVMIGAVGTHILNPPIPQGIPALVLLFLCATAIYMHRKLVSSDAETPAEVTKG